MNRAMRRAATVTVAAGAGLAVLGGTASAHYCYTTKGGDGGQRTVSGAWASAEETAAGLPAFIAGACRERLVEHITELGEQGAVFLGPGLLAGGAVRHGNGPAGIGHLTDDAAEFPECAYLSGED